MIRAYDEWGNVVDIVAWENEIYNKALDDYKNKAIEILKTEYETRYGYLDIMDIREISKQLKKKVK